MLHRVAHVEAGQTVLIHGASGGVGTALAQLGKAAGLKMFGTAIALKDAESGQVVCNPDPETTVYATSLFVIAKEERTAAIGDVRNLITTLNAAVPG